MVGLKFPYQEKILLGNIIKDAILLDTTFNMNQEIIANIGKTMNVIMLLGSQITFGWLVMSRLLEVKLASSRLQVQVISGQLIWKVNGYTGIQTTRNGSKLEMISK